MALQWPAGSQIGGHRFKGRIISPLFIYCFFVLFHGGQSGSTISTPSTPSTPTTMTAPTNPPTLPPVTTTPSPQASVTTSFVSTTPKLNTTTSGFGPSPGPQSRQVTVPPLIIKEPPKTIYFRIGETTEVPCEACGIPQPQYRWEMEEKHFDPSGNNGSVAIQPGVGTLIFACPQARDQGIYQCFAYNEAGVALTVKINFLQAIHEPFQTKETRKNYPNIGDSLTLKCTPPKSVPMATVYWALIAEGSRFTPIDMSDRVTLDPIGNLNFVNVIPEDIKDGQTYACISYNAPLRSMQQGEFNQIIPNGQQVAYHPPAIMWQSPTQQVGIRGGVIMISCIFSGSPTPRVEWFRTDGQLMPDRAQEESFGQQLTIRNLQYSDAGSYECQGINDEAMVPIRRSFTLTIESNPWWVVKPESVDAAENETAVFTCEGESIPKPTYFWYLNGIPITKVPADPRRIVTEKTLTFTMITAKDSQVVQCNVTNKFGYNYTNAYLNVLTKAPFILDQPMLGQKAAEGQTINLTCNVYGSSKPMVCWNFIYTVLI